MRYLPSTDLGFPILLVLCCLASRVRAVAELPDLANRASRPGWKPTHDVGPLEVGVRGLLVPITGPDPFVTSPEVGESGNNESVASLRLWSETGGIGQLFWFKDQATERDSVHFRVRSNAWTEARLALPAMGSGARLRLDPPGTNGTATLGELKLSRPGGSGVVRVVVTSDRVVLTVVGVGNEFEIVELQPEQDESDVATGEAVALAAPKADGKFEVPRFVDRGAGRQDRIDRGFCVGVRGYGGETRAVGVARHAEKFEGTARLHPAPVVPKSRKGLQVQMVEDAIALGVRHAALNVNVSGLVDPRASADSLSWTNQGRVFHFRKSAVEAIPAKRLSDAGADVTLILLAYESGDPLVDAISLHPGYSRQAPNHLGAFNTSTREGAAWFEAAMGFLANRFSRDDGAFGRASRFIIGNEVTAHWYWANEGEVPEGVFIADYERTVRLAHAAVAAETDSVKVFLSLDHHWNLTFGGNPNRAIAGRRLLDGFNRDAILRGNFEWHLAYHPYPENLGDPRTWRDKTALPGADSPRITFRNLEVITDYLKRPEFLLNGEPRRVILSEQGFHSDGTAKGEELQAAAYAYAWEKVARVDGIDAFILHRHVDHGQEGGLNLGLWRRKPGSVADPDQPKPIYKVFRDADTDRREATFRFALPLVGLTNWNELETRSGQRRETP